MDLVKIFLDNGASVDPRNKNETTPLIVATQYGHLEIVKILSNRGADLDAKKKGDWRALHFAALKGHTEIVEFLLENGAEINAKDKNNLTPFHFAAKNIQTEVLKFLIEKEAEVDLENLSSDEIKVVQILLKNDKEKKDAENNQQITGRSSEKNDNNFDYFFEKVPCIICLGPRKGIFAFMPCGHASLCETCCIIVSGRNSNRKCPTCRTLINEYKRIFFQAPDQ